MTRTQSVPNIRALDPEDRRKHERDLIALYLDELCRRGVEEPLSADDLESFRALA